MMRKLVVLAGFLTLAVCAATALGSVGASAPSVVITTYGGAAVSRPQGITFGPDGAIWFANEEGHSIGRITRTGVISPVHEREHQDAIRDHLGL